MRHIIFGGMGFTGKYLAQKLLDAGQRVVICDLCGGVLEGVLDKAESIRIDITDTHELNKIELNRDDIVYHLAARQYHLPVPYLKRKKYFYDVNYLGTKNILEYMDKFRCINLIYTSTDMVYGIPKEIPIFTDHEQNPLGPYGESKRLSEELCREYRKKGFNITILRPRLIIGPGRLGVLKKMFYLVERGLPVPLIGKGQNYYQMISVFDCVDAVLASVDAGVPNEEFNLGSKSPPTVEELLTCMIQDIGSSSKLIKTPGILIKAALNMLDRIGVSLLYREQYELADRTCVVDISKTESYLGWSPKYRDIDMMLSAYKEYKLVRK
jgi:nucleoside-diphosphate-sugar epimerase